MSADEIRRAAALMRERAEGAWSSDRWERQRYANSNPATITLRRSEYVFVNTYCGEPENAAHIASWHPAVALAVADWLDGVAHYAEARADDEWHDLDGDPIAPEDTHAIGSALAVATAYIGEQP